MGSVVFVYQDGTEEVFSGMELGVKIGFNLSEDTIIKTIEDGGTFISHKDYKEVFIPSKSIKKFYFGDGSIPESKGGCGVWCPGCSKCGY